MGHVRHLATVIGGMAGAQWVQNSRWRGVNFGLKSPCLKWVQLQRHILGLQCHSSGCSFWLEWSVWLNETQGTYHTSRIGDGGHVRCSMGPNRSLKRVFISLKSHVWEEISSTFLASNFTHMTAMSGWNGSYLWIHLTQEDMLDIPPER